MPRPSSTALPIAYVVLRILLVLTWFFGACLIALLALTFIAEPWAMKALRVSSFPDPHKVIWGMRAIAALGLASLPMNFAMLRRMLAIVETVRAGDPFVAANAYRLQAIAWLLLLLQLLSMVIGGIGKMISTPAHPFRLDAGFSLSGWLAVILTFVLARVFAEGTLMREDLEGTV